MSRKHEHQRLSPASARVRRAHGPAPAASLCDEPDAGEKYPPWQKATGSSRADLAAGGRAGRRLAQAAAAMLLFVAPAQAATTERVSVSSSGAQANARSFYPAVSADGQFVVFTSEASNLVAGDTNAAADVFIRNLRDGTTERISLTASGEQADGACVWGSVSGDGRFVAFESNAPNLGAKSVYVRDRASNTLERIGTGRQPSISEDGRYVAYVSGYNFSEGSVPGIVVYDRVTNTRVVHVEDELKGQGNMWFSYPLPALDESLGRAALAPDAGTVGYFDSDGRVLDLIAQVEHRASVPPGAPEPNGWSVVSALAAGQVAFGSSASNLVAGDTNGTYDVFVRRLPLGSSERVSISSSGGQGNGWSFNAGLSPDGRYVAFSSRASNLVADDANGRLDLFLRDLEEKTTTRVSLTATGGEANADSGAPGPALSAELGVAGEARVIAFGSSATNLVTRDTNGVDDVFVRRR